MRFVRSLIFHALFYLWTLVLGILYLPLLILPRRGIVLGGRAWCVHTMWLLNQTVGLTYEVKGRENVPRDPVIYAAKHPSHPTTH